MSRFALTLSLLVLVISRAPALAQTPEATVRTILAFQNSGFTTIKQKSDAERRDFTPALYKSWSRINGRDFNADPYMGTQESGAFTVRSARTERIASDRARVTMNFAIPNSDTKLSVAYMMQRIDGDWRIDDIVYLDDGRSLRNFRLATAPTTPSPKVATRDTPTINEWYEVTGKWGASPEACKASPPVYDLVFTAESANLGGAACRISGKSFKSAKEGWFVDLKCRSPSGTVDVTGLVSTPRAETLAVNLREYKSENSPFDLEGRYYLCSR